MTRPSQISFKELEIQDINQGLIDDLNVLLPQLSSNASPVTEASLNDVFDNGTRLFGAFDGERLVGVTLLVTMVILVGLKAWIEDVIVDEQYRGRGIASTLMEMAETESKLDGAKSINLTSNPNRPEARRLYGGLGYVLRETGVFRKTF